MSAAEPAGEGTERASQAPVTAALQSLYRRVWRFCAGWNRTPFVHRQLSFIRVRSGLDAITMVLPLGSTEAVTVVVNDRRVVVLNAKLFPRRPTSEEALFNFLAARRGRYARFVFLHELAHHLFHEGPKLHDNASPCDTANALADVQFEIEADFYALLALVPDRMVGELRSATPDRRVLSTRIAMQLGLETALDERHRRSIVDLAHYRLELFEAYSQSFLSASESSFGRGNRPFRNVRTSDASVAASTATGASELLQIMTLHPCVRSRPALRTMLASSGAVPFAHLGEDEPPSSRSRGLTHRIRPDQLLAALPPSVAKPRGRLQWRTLESARQHEAAQPRCSVTAPAMCEPYAAPATLSEGQRSCLVISESPPSVQPALPTRCTGAGRPPWFLSLPALGPSCRRPHES